MECNGSGDAGLKSSGAETYVHNPGRARLAVCLQEVTRGYCTTDLKLLLGDEVQK